MRRFSAVMMVLILSWTLALIMPRDTQADIMLRRSVIGNVVSDASNALYPRVRGTAGQSLAGRSGSIFVNSKCGFWYILRPQLVSGIEQRDPLSVGQLYLQPTSQNPVSTRTDIRFSLPGRAPTTLRLFDVQGRLLRELANANMGPGSYSIPLDAAALSNGTYFYQLESGNATQQRKLVVVK